MPSINNLTTTLPFPPPISQTKKITLGSRLKKIARIVVRTLSLGLLCKRSPLKNTHIAVITDFKKRKLEAFPTNINAQPTKATDPKFNESLEGMRDFARKLVELALGCAQNKYITPNVEQFATAAKDLPEFLKGIAQEVISIGSISAKPIFEIISLFNKDNEAQKQIHRVLNWALKDIKPENKDQLAKFREEFKEDLLKKILENNAIAPTKAPKGVEQQNVDDQLKASSEKILGWLLDTDHSQSPFDLFKDDPHIECVLQTALLVLTIRKIDLYTVEVKQNLGDGNLTTIVESTIRENTLKVTDILSKRLAAVIDNMGEDQFTVLFDEIIKVTGQHVTNIAKSHKEAEKIAKEHQALKEYAQNIANKDIKNPKEKEIVVINACKAYLANLEKKGGLAAIEEDALLATFLKLTGNKAPSINNNITESISKHIIEILLPPVTKNGKTLKGLENLLSEIKEQFTLPPEFTNLLDKAKEMAEMIISKDQFAELKILGNAALEFKDLALESCGEAIKLGLNEAIELVVKQMSIPEELNLVLVNSALPSSIDSMFRFFTDDLIQANIHKLAPLLHELPSTEGKLLEALFKIAQKEASEFKFTEADREAFNKSVKYRLDEIVELLNLVRKDPKKNNVKSTVAIIKEYYKYDTSSKDNNTHLADFVDVALHTGEFGSLASRLFDKKFARNRMSKQMTSALQNMRKSYRPLLNMAVTTAQEKYLKETEIQKWITPSTPDDEVKHAQELAAAQKKLPDEIDKVARLGYDMLMFKTKCKVPLIGKFFLKRIVGPTAEKISRVTKILFNRIIGRHAFNVHLLSRIFGTALSGISITVTAPRGTKPLLLPMQQNSLGNDHVPVSAEFINERPFAIDIPKNGEKIPCWKRIVNVVIKKFKAFFLWLTPRKTTLSDRQIKLMKSLEVEANTPTETLLGTQTRRKIGTDESPIVTTNIVPKKQTPYYFKEKNPDLNSSLEKVGNFVQKFMTELSKEVYEKKIGPKIQSLENNANKLPDILSKTLDYINRIIAPLSTTIVDKIVKKGYKIEKLDESSQGFFNILFKNLKTVDLEEMKNELKKINVTLHLGVDENDLEHYLTPICTWMLQDTKKKEDIQSLLHFSENYKKDKAIDNVEYEKTMPKFYVAAIQWLVKFKIESQGVAFKNFLERKELSRLIQTHLDKNMRHLSTLLFNRVAGLVNTITDAEYKELFDACAGDIKDQMENLIDAEKVVRGLLIEEMENPALLQSCIAQELTSGKTKPQKSGEQKPAEPIYKLHDLAKALLHPPNYITPQDLKAYKTSEENKVFLKIVERMINLTFPKEGEHDALLELWNNIIVEPEVTEAINDVRQFIQALLPAKYVGKFGTVEEKVITLIKEFVINSVKERAKHVLAENLRDSFKIISDNERRQELFVDHFPIMHEQLIKSFALKIASDIESKPENLFKMMIEGNKIELIAQLLSLCSGKFGQSWNHLNIDREKFVKNYLPYISDGLSHHIFKDFIISYDFKKLNLNTTHKFFSDLKKLIRIDDAAAMNNISAYLINMACTKYKWNKDEKNKLEKARKELVEPFIGLIVHELKEKQKEVQLQNRNAELTDIQIENALKLYLKGENDKDLRYADMIFDMVEMGLPGFWGLGLIDFLGAKTKISEKITEGLLPAMHPVRASLRGVIDLAVPGLAAKCLGDVNYVKNFVIPQTLETFKADAKRIEAQIVKETNVLNNDLKAASEKQQEYKDKIEALKQQNVKLKDEIAALEKKIAQKKVSTGKKFTEGLELTSRILFDLIKYSMPNKVAKLAWRGAAGRNHEKLLKALQKFYQKFFDNNDLNETLLVNITEKALDLIETQNTA